MPERQPTAGAAGNTASSTAGSTVPKQGPSASASAVSMTPASLSTSGGVHQSMNSSNQKQKGSKGGLSGNAIQAGSGGGLRGVHTVTSIARSSLDKSSNLSGSGGDLFTAILMGEVETSTRKSLSRVNSTGSRRDGRVLGRQAKGNEVTVACILGPQGSEDRDLTPLEREQKKIRDKEKMEKRISEIVIGDFY